FLDESLDLSNSQLRIHLAPNGSTFTGFATTPNQQRVAQHLEAASASATGDLADAFDAIRRSTAAEVPALLDALGGESLTAFATARQIRGERTARALHRRARDIARGEGRAFYQAQVEEPDVAAGGDLAAPIRPVRAGVWFDGLGLYGHLGGEAGEAD